MRRLERQGTDRREMQRFLQRAKVSISLSHCYDWQLRIPVRFLPGLFP
jgi:hypothetical protein